MNVGIVILNWNNPDATIECLRSVTVAIEQVRIGRITLIVADNGSQPHHYKKLERALCDIQTLVHLVRLADNLGYAGGMNAGVQALEAAYPDLDYFWLLNNDTVVARNSLATMLAFCRQHPDTAICGPTLISRQTGKIECAGGATYCYWLGIGSPHLSGEDANKPGLLIETAPAFSYIHGAAMLIKGDFLRRINGLPEDYFMYFEELELSKKLDEGETLGWCRDATVEHGQRTLTTHRGSEMFRAAQATISCLFFTRKHYPSKLPSVFFTRVLAYSVLNLITLRPHRSVAALQSAVLFILGRRRYTLTLPRN